MEFYKQTIKEFIEDVESDKASPGGGSVAGLIGALSGALNSMVYSLTIGKKKYEELDEETKTMINSFREKSKEFTYRSLELMEEDRNGFLKLMECYKLPKDTEEEKLNRSNSIKEGTKEAMMPPLKLARESFAFYENLYVMNKYGNKMLLSDLGMSAILLHCTIESAVMNVKVNLNALRYDEKFFNQIKEELDILLNKSKNKKDEIVNQVNSVIFQE
ncbi:cyclodeaminase/cyclohydrolase family protein [Clostridium taeniosporum]|uniref:Formiminotransferase-cyclodeaminase n=1 Tax=Clostridium taeniosporum TaxID=394958 RepID=A0A1D7XKV2_9CLOT|nr:cyclodeaminase/cyclohydrolase family protein [Clostridium taeniosporum]AOR23954.1 formiminotransferase-cyclodeaminase [Clostridium taeniosporum]